MNVRPFGVAIAISTIVPQPAFAAAPIGEWRIEPSEARCVAVRQYGEADKPITLALKAPPYESDVLQLAIIRDGYRKSADQAGARLTIDAQEFKTYALGYPLPGPKKRTASLINLAPDVSGALRKATSLTISVRGSVNEAFTVSPSTSLWTALDECVGRLKTTWNIGEQNAGKFARRPQGSLAGIFTAADYPRDALSSGFAGSTHLMLLIDEAGAVKDCTVLETSGMAVLDSKACGVIMARSKFEPAFGQDGKPIKSSYRGRIAWQLAK